MICQTAETTVVEDHPLVKSLRSILNEMDDQYERQRQDLIATLPNAHVKDRALAMLEARHLQRRETSAKNWPPFLRVRRQNKHQSRIPAKRSARKSSWAYYTRWAPWKRSTEGCGGGLQAGDNEAERRAAEAPHPGMKKTVTLQPRPRCAGLLPGRRPRLAGPISAALRKAAGT